MVLWCWIFHSRLAVRVIFYGSWRVLSPESLVMLDTKTISSALRKLASPVSLLYSCHSVSPSVSSLFLHSYTGLCAIEYVYALGGDAVLPCLFGDENEYSVNSTSILCLPWDLLFRVTYWQENFGFPLGNNLLLFAVKRSLKTWPQPTQTSRETKSSSKLKCFQMLRVCLVEVASNRSVQLSVLLCFISKF